VSYYLSTVLVYLGVDVLAAWALNIQFGWAGVPNFAFIIFQAIGAYAAAGPDHISVGALTQRFPPREYMESVALSAAPGNIMRMEDVVLWCEANGYQRASTVRDVGDYASRGGILDLFPPGAAAPIRLDFFGDTLESIRAFDPESQRSTGQLRSLDLVPMTEARLTTDSIKRFRQAYAAEFGAPAPSDDLYTAVSEGRRAIGLEHWLPLLYDKLDTIFDYVGDAPFVLDARTARAIQQLEARLVIASRPPRPSPAPPSSSPPAPAAATTASSPAPPRQDPSTPLACPTNYKPPPPSSRCAS